MKYALVGYGKMGRSIDAVAASRGHERVAIVEGSTPAAPALERLGRAELAFEFSRPAAAERNVLEALDAGVSVVCGTTGWDPAASAARSPALAQAGLIVAPNFSVGMNLFFKVVAEAGRLYGALGLHDPYVHEAHHRGKRDAPSGTAKKLAEILLEADPSLPAGTLSVSSTRAGSEPGTHWVGFDGEHDLITLCHSARSRSGFALGAVLAAEWLVGRTGLHGFDEMLDDRLARDRSGGKA